MTDEMPDFDSTFIPPLPAKTNPIKKRRKKPTARKVAVNVAPAPKKRVVKKRKAAKKVRRGRPPGSANKRKARTPSMDTIETSAKRFAMAYNAIRSALATLPKGDRHSVVEIIRGEL